MIDLNGLSSISHFIQHLYISQGDIKHLYMKLYVRNGQLSDSVMLGHFRDTGTLGL
jgi:hypothetical protein